MTVLDDLLKEDLKVIFCGTAAGHRSAALGQYYAGRGNRFWPTLHEAGFTERLLPPADYALLLDSGIGLTDLSKIGKGMDRDLARGDFDAARFRTIVETLRPGFVAFTSKRAAQEFFGVKRVDYGLHPDRIGKTRLFVLPSPSGAARAYWDVGHWSELARAAGFTG